MALASFSELAASLGRLPAELDAAKARGVLEAAAIMQVAVAVAEGRNAGKEIARTGIVPVASGEIIVKMLSRKAHLLDHDTKPHEIGPKKKQALFGGGYTHPFAGAVSQPGTTGNLAWEKAYEAARPKMIEAVAGTIPAAVIAAFR